MSALVKGPHSAPLALCHERHTGKLAVCAQKRSLVRTRLCWPLSSEFRPFRTMCNDCLLFIRHPACGALSQQPELTQAERKAWSGWKGGDGAGAGWGGTFRACVGGGGS